MCRGLLRCKADERQQELDRLTVQLSYAILSKPSAYLVSLGNTALAQVDAGDAQQLETLQRAGLTRLVTTLRAVAPRSLVIVMTPVPRVELTEQYLGAFDATSQMCSEVTTECGGHVIAVCDVVTRSLVGVFLRSGAHANINTGQRRLKPRVSAGWAEYVLPTCVSPTTADWGRW